MFVITRLTLMTALAVICSCDEQTPKLSLEQASAFLQQALQFFVSRVGAPEALGPQQTSALFEQAFRAFQGKTPTALEAPAKSITYLTDSVVRAPIGETSKRIVFENRTAEGKATSDLTDDELKEEDVKARWDFISRVWNRIRGRDSSESTLPAIGTTGGLTFPIVPSLP